MSSLSVNTINAPVERSLFSRIFRNGENGKSSLLKSSEKLLASLESMQVNLLFADPEYTLIYANEKAVKTLSGIREDIRKEFNVSVEDMVGGSIHRFHRNPDAIERILRNPLALPHEAKFDFGAVRLKTAVNGITPLDGEIIGFIVNWEDKSKKVRKNEEMTKLVAELEIIEDGYGSKNN